MSSTTRTVAFVQTLAEKAGAQESVLHWFVFPSARETFGLAPVEAAQEDVPVVASDNKILREVLAVGDAPCAPIVDARDTKIVPAAVRSLLDDPDLYAALTGAGRRLAQRYPLDAMIEEHPR